MAAKRPDEGQRPPSGALLASAYPDRIAMARGKRGEFLMANGRAAALEPHDALAGEPFLAIGEVAGRAASARILLAAPLTLADIEAVAGAAIETVEELAFDRASASLRARRRRRLGALVARRADARRFRRTSEARSRSRAALWRSASRACPGARRSGNGATASCSCAAPRASPGRIFRTRRSPKIPDWLAPFVVGKTRLDEIGADDLAEALRARLPWDLARRLDEEAPTHFVAPTGTAAPIDYEAEGGPSIALRVQELFGLERASVGRRRAHSADPASPVAGAPADPDHPRPAELLARLLGRRAFGPPRPLSAPLLAGGPGGRRADHPGEAAGDVRRRRLGRLERQFQAKRFGDAEKRCEARITCLAQ